MFLQKLTAGMRAVDKQSSVVWYDSITHCGELKWQNQLNDHNRYDTIRTINCFSVYLSLDTVLCMVATTLIE